MPNRERNVIQCEWFKNPDRQWVATAWRDLEARAETNVFLSWLWIGAWLDCFVDDFFVIEASLHGQTVGLGIVVEQSQRLPARWLGRRYYLHRTGQTDEDQIWIEYNDFLMDIRETAAIRQAMCSSVAYWFEHRDSFIIGASQPENFAELHKLGLAERTVWETTAYALDLQSLREHHQSVLATLSRNARYQITRSLREYEHLGPVTVKTMTSVEDGLALFRQAKPYHLARWGGSPTGSGMANPKFVAFHETLITRGMASGTVELHHICAGTETIGIIYNFRYQDTVYFYLGAMNYSHQSAHFKPGLVSHYLLIEQAKAQGANIYDFMGGIARYKSTFSNRQKKLVVRCYEHPRLFLFAENYARTIKHHFQSF